MEWRGRRIDPRSVFVAVVIGIAITGMALRLGRAQPAGPPPPAPPSAAVRPLPAGCVVAGTDGSTGVTTVCELSPARAAPYLGFTPERPESLPPGIHLVSQQLRTADAPGAPGPADERATGFVQTWAPVGVIPDAAGEYPQHLRLVERVRVAGDVAGCDGQFVAVKLGNGHAACVGSPGGSGTHRVVWHAYGVVHVLEARDVSRAQMLQFAASFP